MNLSKLVREVKSIDNIEPYSLRFVNVDGKERRTELDYHCFLVNIKFTHEDFFNVFEQLYSERFKSSPQIQKREVQSGWKEMQIYEEHQYLTAGFDRNKKYFYFGYDTKNKELERFVDDFICEFI